MKRRVISILMALVMLLTMLPTTAVAAMFEEDEFVATVYVDGTNGNNNNDGSTEATATKGMTYAYSALYKAMEAVGKANDPDAVGRIVVLNDVSFSSSAGPTPGSSDTVYAKTHDFTILVTGKTGDEALVIKNNYINLGPTVYENINLTKADGAGTYTFFCANGYPLVIGEDVVCNPNSSGSYMSLMGGVMPTTKVDGKLPSTSLTGSDADNGKSFTGDTDLTVMSGTWRNIYAGSYKGTMTGDVSLVMTGGTVTYKLGSTFSGTVKGNSTLEISDTAVENTIYCAGTGSGKVTGDVSLSLENVTASTDVDTANVSGSVALSIANSEIVGTVSGSDSLILTASEGETLSIGGGNLKADRFIGGGSLVLGANAKLDAAEVSGSTKLTIDGTPFAADYVTAPETAADDAFVFVPTGDETMSVSVSGGLKRWAITSGKELSALKLTAPEDVSLTLYTGFTTSGSKITADAATTEDGITTYVFNNLPAGNYCYVASGSGYYKIKKNIYYSEAEAEVGQVIDANPGLMADDGFQSTGQIALYTDEVMETILVSDPDLELWKDYKHVFETPVYAEGRPAHQQTTQDEMMDYLASLDDENDKMYTYIAGTTPVYNYEIPVVVFSNTDLSGAETMEEAAELIQANGKPTIHYQAMIHPNEPGGGEPALAMIKALDGTYGAEILDKINIYVIPRINGDGAYVYQRANVAQGIDMNRDHLYVQSKEVEIIHNVYNLFMPEVTIDGHEFSSSSDESTSSTMDDVQVGTAGNLNSGEDFTKYSQAIVQETFKAAKALNLRPYNYGDYASTVNNAIGRPYYALYGSLSFLIETRGIGFGLGWMERRALSQYVVAETIINYVVENAETINKTSNDERQRLVELGGVYGEEDDILVLQHGVTKNSYYEIDRPSWNLTDGSLSSAGTGKKVYYYDQILASRSRPTAYVMSKDAENIDKIVANMDKNGIAYYAVDADSTILLQQYMGSKAAATLTSETAVTFENGAYVFPMDQVAANVLAMTMEPDVVDSEGYNGTLLQSGLVTPDANGMIAIYRYSHDLVDGKVSLVQVPDAPQGLSVVHPTVAFGTGSIIGLDPTKSYEYRAESDIAYTVLPAGTTEITGLEMGAYYVRYSAAGEELASRDCKLDVIDSNITSYIVYVDPANGSDEADGHTEATAVKTLAAGYNALTALIKYAPEGTEGTVVLLSDVTFTAEAQLPDHTYPVLLTSATGAEGLVSAYNFSFNGPTRLDDISITLTTNALRYIAANGNKLVIGENVNTVPSGSYYFCLAGGGKSSAVVGDVDLTIHSGTFRNIYAAGYTGNVTGDVKLTMTGGATTAVIQTSYSGTTTGNVTMDLSGVTIGGKIFGGNTSSKNVNGDVTIILGEGVTAKSDVYAGSRDAGSVVGDVSIIVDGADVKGVVYDGCSNATGTVDSCTVTLKSGTLAKAVQADEIVLNTSGDKTLTLSGSITADEVIGGGTVVIPADAVITATAASGVTLVEINGTADETAYYVTAPTTVPASAFTCTCVEGMGFVAQDAEGQRYWYLGTVEPEIPEEPEEPAPSETPDDKLTAMNKAIEALIEQVEAYIQSQADRLEAQIRYQLETAVSTLEAQLNELNAQLENASDELKAEIQAAIADAETQLAKAKADLEQAYLDATTAEYVAGCDSYYVALGDAAALSETTAYADILADELGVEYVNLADAALNSAAIEAYLAAGAEEIAKADLITVSMGANDISNFVLKQMETFLNGGDTTIDWAALNLSDEMMVLLSKTLDKMHQYLAEQMTDAEMIDMGLLEINPLELVTVIADSYLYGTLSFSLNFAPALNAIHAANPDAQVVVVGMAEPFAEVLNPICNAIGMDVSAVSPVLDAITEITSLEYLVYAMLTPGTTFIAAPDATSDLDSSITITTDRTMVFKLDFQTSEAGHAYIAERILNALTVEKADHVYGEWISISETEHQRTCELCGTAFETEAHADANNDHNCDVCGTPVSECADANGDHKCDSCGDTVSECADANGDHKCDSCGDTVSECADANGDHKCDSCGDTISECADANGDHKCDSCGDTVSECADANGDHKCDSCGDTVSECADANNDHKCDSCGETISEHADANNDHKCDSCGETVSECADANNDHKCDSCGETVSEHADANNDHKCDSCGSDVSVHTDANKDHKCDTCGTELSQHTDIDNDDKCDVCGTNLSSGGGGGGSSSGGSSKPAIDPDPAPAPAPVENPFVDVKTGDYFYDAVLWAVENDITTGVTETQFVPNDICTRAQMVTFLWRAMGSPAPKSTSTPFTDIVKGAYYYDAVLWGTENGLIKGTSETTFSPNDTITRSQTVTFLWRSANSPETSAASIFTDIGEGAYYYDAVVWAAENKITKGTSATTFSPEDPCLRGQILTFMFNHMAN